MTTFLRTVDSVRRRDRLIIPGFRGMSLREFFKRLYQSLSDDAVTDSAAQLSYYFLFSLFPALVFLVTLAAYLPLEGAVDALVGRMSYLMPDDALALVQEQLKGVVTETRPRLLTLGVLTTLWTASRGVDAIRKALNLAYHVTESRPYWRTQLVAIGMTLASMVLIILAFGMFVVGGEFGSWLAEKLHVSQQFHAAWSWARWPFTTVVVMFAAALMYYFLPDVEQEFRFITPGSVVGSLTWLGATWGFTWYVEHFGKYNVTYGSLGGVIVLMLWLYIGGLILIVGGEINSIIEHASDEGKAPGARRPGEAGPPGVDGQPPPITAGAAKRAETGRRFQWAFWRRWRHS